MREEITKCHRAEGVNHYEACHDLVQHYLELLKDAKVRMRYKRKEGNTFFTDSENFSCVTR